MNENSRITRLHEMRDASRLGGGEARIERSTRRGA